MVPKQVRIGNRIGRYRTGVFRVKARMTCAPRSNADTHLTDPLLDLDDAVARLEAFRAAWNTGDVIDEKTALAADGIDTILSFPRHHKGQR